MNSTHQSSGRGSCTRGDKRRKERELWAPCAGESPPKEAVTTLLPTYLTYLGTCQYLAP
jgi:hypothetical protein